MTTTEQVIFVVSGLIIIAYFIYMLGHPWLWRAFKQRKDFKTKHPKKCTCELDQEFCNNQIQVSDEGVISQPDYYKCPSMMKKILKTAKNANLIIKIHQKD